MTVINPNSISGITSITLPSGDGNVLTIHTNDGVERFRIDSSGNVKVGSACTISQDGDVFFTGVTTATTFTGAHSGNGANLTNLPAANVTGTLPAISGANLTNLPAANITGTLPAIDGSALTGIGGTDFIHAEQISVSGVTTSQAFVPTTGQLSHRNIVINGAMRIAQRGTSSTSDGYQTVDRFYQESANNDESPTFAQVDVSSSDSGENPYAAGITKAFKITNGNQTSGAQTNSYARVSTVLEAGDLRNSGWNYTSSSSFITLSFYVKSSVAQNFYGMMFTQDGTTQSFSFETGALTANTWKRVTVTAAGTSNIQFDDNAKQGFYIYWWAYNGTDYTASSGNNFGSFGAFNSSARTPDNTTTWWTTNDATFEITGVQLEVGPVATPFEHRSYGDELKLCQRYFEIIEYEGYVFHGYQPSASSCEFFIHWNTEKRANPSVTLPTVGTSSGQINPTNYQGSNLSGGSLGVFTIKKVCARVTGGSWSNGTAGAPCALYSGGASAYIYISAEL